jgi:hypothetical protein
LTWKALNHPNVLPLLGVVMTETQLAMVSEWMTNGNINQFVAAHRDVNRFELVGFLFGLLPSSLVIDDDVISAVGRRREGLDLYARSRNDPRGSQGGASSNVFSCADRSKREDAYLYFLCMYFSLERHTSVRSTSWSIKLATPASQILACLRSSRTRKPRAHAHRAVPPGG